MFPTLSFRVESHLINSRANTRFWVSNCSSNCPIRRVVLLWLWVVFFWLSSPVTRYSTETPKAFAIFTPDLAANSLTIIPEYWEISGSLIISVRKLFADFSWGKSYFDVNVLKAVVEHFPINSSGKSDYNFICIQQKFAVKNVLDWKTGLFT